MGSTCIVFYLKLTTTLEETFPVNRCDCHSSRRLRELHAFTCLRKGDAGIERSSDMLTYLVLST